jgi:hypothetical protein
MQELLQSQMAWVSNRGYRLYSSGSVAHIPHSERGNLTSLFAPSYKEQIEKVSRLKEDTVRAILKNSQEIAIFKEEVSKHLQELRGFAEAE